MIFDKLRELDRSETCRRQIKKIRNLFIDPLPRMKELIFESCEYRHPDIFFRFRAENKVYTNHVSLGEIQYANISKIHSEIWDRALLAVGLAMVPQHFLLADFGRIRIECANLDKSTFRFYEDYYRKGLAEFRYRQGLTPTRHIDVYSGIGDKSSKEFIFQTDNKILMLNGGGKDTAVMASLINSTGIPSSWCLINPRKRQEDLIKASGINDAVSIKIRYDQSIFMNKRYHWAHIPFLGLAMPLSLLGALAYGFRYVTTGNEQSSNYGNIRYRNVEINHQHTKSHCFEKDFNEHISGFVTRGITFFSALRPFYDIRIGAMLSQLDEYLDNFVSCNRGGEGWCNNCAKCAFTFLILSPFVEITRLIDIFGINLFENPKIRMLMLDLMRGNLKPWECVGVQEECRLAAALALTKYPQMDFSEYPYRHNFESTYKNDDFEAIKHKYLYKFHEPHNIPIDLYIAIKKKATDLTPDLNFNNR